LKLEDIEARIGVVGSSYYDAEVNLITETYGTKSKLPFG